MEHLVVFAHGDTEDDCGDVLETVDPLLPFGSLAADVEQFEVEILEREVHLDDASGLHSGPEDILFRWHVVLLS